MQALDTTLDPLRVVDPLKRIVSTQNDVAKAKASEADLSKLIKSFAQTNGLNNVSDITQLRASLLDRGVYFFPVRQANGELAADIATVTKVNISAQDTQELAGEICIKFGLKLPESPRVFYVNSVLARGKISAIPESYARTIVELEDATNAYVMMNSSLVDNEFKNFSKDQTRRWLLSNELVHIAIAKTFPKAVVRNDLEIESPKIPFPLSLVQINESMSDLNSLIAGEPITLLLARDKAAGRSQNQKLTRHLIDETIKDLMTKRYNELAEKRFRTPEEQLLLKDINGFRVGSHMRFIDSSFKPSPILERELREAAISKFSDVLLNLRKAFEMAEALH